MENAVTHGAARRTGPGYVVLRIRRLPSAVRVEVRDSGGGFLPPDGSHTGVGMDNVRQRLRLTYGAQATLDHASEAGETVVSFEVPTVIAKNGDDRQLGLTAR